MAGLLRLQQIYQSLRPGNESFQVEAVRRIQNTSEAIDYLQSMEEQSRWSNKYVVLDCPTAMAKEIVVTHVRDVTLGKRTYHYLLSGLVSPSIGPAKSRSILPRRDLPLFNPPEGISRS